MGLKHTKLRQEVVDDLVKQTAFTEAEIQDWYKGFLKDCPTGHITIDEFRKIYAKFFPYGDPARFAEYMFRAFDRNHDGLVDFHEFLVSISVTSRGSLEQKLRWSFCMFDLDGDDYLSRKDLCDVIASIYSLIGSTAKFPEDEATPERRADKIMTQMDSNGDDRISFDEFSEGVKSDDTLLRVLCAGVSGSGLSSTMQRSFSNSNITAEKSASDSPYLRAKDAAITANACAPIQETSKGLCAEKTLS